MFDDVGGRLGDGERYVPGCAGVKAERSGEVRSRAPCLAYLAAIIDGN
jgi:hypothetical protein